MLPHFLQFPTRFFPWEFKIVSSNEYVFIEVYIKNNLIDEIVTSLSPEVMQKFGHFSFYEINSTNILRGPRRVWELKRKFEYFFLPQKNTSRYINPLNAQVQ